MDGAHLKLRSKFQRPFFTSSPVQAVQTQQSPQTPPVAAMNEDDKLASDDVSAPQEPWSTPTSHVDTSAVSLAGFSYCIPPDHSVHPSMETIVGNFTPPQDTPSRPVSTHQDFTNHGGHFEENYWMQKPFESQYPFHGHMADVPIGQAYTSDEAIPVFDLEHQGLPANFHLNLDEVAQSRRISGSSFSMSTSGAMSDMHSYDDFSTALSDAPSFYSEMPPKSNRTSWMSSTQLSPVASPRIGPNRSDLVRTQSRGRASPSPRPNVRSAPYVVEGPRSAKRWSTGTYGRRSAPSSVYHAGSETHMMHQPTSQPPFLMSCPPISQRNSMLLPTQLPSQLPSQSMSADLQRYDAPAPLLSHGLLRMLQSNADVHALQSRYADLSDPPDLFGALSEEQIPPPEEDLHPEDPEMTPREQDLRFEGDLYTPRWVRGHGNKREGWCGICKPGRWLVLKNSAYWYDKSFSHGVSAATGAQFKEPLDTRRMDGNPDVWEGLCSSCDEWIALVSSKKKGTTWFRHAYKCHSHPKAKDSAKRRRESGPGKGAGTPSASKVCKTEAQQPVTPHLHSSSVVNTPMPTTPGYHMPCHSHHYMPLTAQPQGLVANESYAHNMI